MIGIIEWWQRVSESGRSEDFGKPRDEWRAAKIAKGELGAVRLWLPRLIVSLAVLIGVVILASALAGCHAGWPCSDHGGVQWTNSKVYQCNDGSWE